MRECDKCIYHTDNGCSKWECKGTVTLEDYKAQIRAEVIEEFADTMQLVKLVECDDVPRELVEAIENQIGICALRVKEKMLKEQK